MMKKIVAAMAVLVAVVAIGAYFFLSNLNSIIKSALEHYGSQVTQTSVDISSVDVSLTTGQGSVSGFRLGNPKSYVAAKAISIGSVDFKLDTKTVTGSQPIIIDVINVNSPDVLFEVGNDGNNNLQALNNNVQSYSKSSAKTSSSETESAPSRKVIIKNLYIRDGKVAITHALLRGRDLSAALPTIHLTNIGQSEKGATPEEVAQRILTEVTKQAANVGSAALKKELMPLQKIQDSLKGKGSNPLKEMTKGFLDR